MLLTALHISSDVVRVIIYLSIVYKTISLANLYFLAWKNMKRTPIIKSLGDIFATMAFYFSIMSFVLLVDLLITDKLKNIGLGFTSIALFVLLVKLDNFQQTSLHNEVKKVAETKKKHVRNKRPLHRKF